MEEAPIGQPDYDSEPLSLPKLMKPYTAVGRLEHYCGGAFAAKQLLADKIRDGEIRAYAFRSWLSSEPNLRKASLTPDDGVEHKIHIRPGRLIMCERWTENVPQWNWKQGNFFAVLKSKPIRRRIFRRVMLARVDVESILVASQSAQQKELSNRGRPTKLDGWNKVWTEILRIAIEERFDKEHLGDMQAFRARVASAAVGNGANAIIQEKTFEPLLNSIYREFVDPRAN